MYNQKEFLDASGNLDYEAVRAHFLRTGKLDRLEKGQTVWIDHNGMWVTGRLIRRIPGDCWIAKLDCPGLWYSKITVMVKNFGGVKP
jgi:hypothetical protein